MIENLYISISDDKSSLTIDGSLALFGKLLETLRVAEAQTRQAPRRVDPATATTRVVEGMKHDAR